MNLFKVILLSIITSLPIYGQRQYQKQVYTHAIDNIDEFIEFLSYPNDANFKSDINELIIEYLFCVKKFVLLIV